MHIGMIGLGRMGANMVRRLLRAGHQCVVYNRNPAKAQALVEPELDEAAAATLFVGTVQGLVVQTLLAGDPQTLQPAARRLWPLYLRGIGVRQP